MCSLLKKQYIKNKKLYVYEFIISKTSPFLTRHVFSDPYKENHHKTQQCSNGTVQEKINFILEAYDPNLMDSMKMSVPPNLTYGSRQPPENDYMPRIHHPGQNMIELFSYLCLLLRISC